MIRIAIVDDDRNDAETLQHHIAEYEKETQNHFQVKVYRDGDALLTDYKAQYDLILMDIQMRFVDGMTAAEELRKIDEEVMIIFITNMAQYAIKGYEVGALDYMLKPVSYFAFSQKMSKSLERLKKRKSKSLLLNVKGGIYKLAISDLYYVESDGHKMIYHTAKGDLVSTGTMKAVEEKLMGYSFSKANKGYLVNLAQVEGVHDKCVVVNGEKLLISRSRLNDFMQELTRYWSEI